MSIDTKIAQDVKDADATHTYDHDTFNTIHVAKYAEGNTENTENTPLFMVVADEGFAQERLKTAKKHYQEFGKIPDKGQFPFITLTDGVLKFTGDLLITNPEEDDKLSKI